MRKVIHLIPIVIAAYVSLAAGTVVSQDTLSGTWAATTEAPAGIAVAPSAVFGPQFGLTMSGDAVEVKRTMRTNVVVSTHRLDGTEAAVTLPGRSCFGDTSQRVAITKRGAGFDYTVLGTLPAGGSPSSGGPTYTFRTQGDALVVASTIRDGSGERQVGTVYRRTTNPLPPPFPAPNVTVAPATIEALGWLVGDWVGTVGGSQVEERWMSPAGGAMIGTNRSTRGTPALMVGFEFLCIAQRAGGLVYTAMPNGGGTTDFLLTTVSAERVTFENPAHDFPKAITYTRRADGGFDATISGAPGQRALTYSFQKKWPGAEIAADLGRVI